MNDDERNSSFANEIFEIIESFSPGYCASLKACELSKGETLKIKIALLSTLTINLIYSIFQRPAIGAYTIITIIVAGISLYGLWRIEHFEQEIGIWKWGFKPLWGTRITYPYRWEFHSAENLSIARKAGS